ncbi:hypothetical protein MHSWG343_04660 [Candidatus Mycoplasma haematohominis]|uniref:Uncharacterized protein n=1 Tax=Candidatus Mycoplasma haematohominis TaxID=1494318 RepID=A0A478FSM8_9MOLU|nr:hypothetical protein MHSWG343_04660 [Candidatus Mycoplasma haemohominis]
MSVAKAAAAGAAALALAAGGYGVSTLFSGGMPDYDPLTKSTGKYVSEYQDYFVAADKNEPWWEWVYKSRYLVNGEKDVEGDVRPTPKTAFASLDRGSGNTDKDIQKVCKDFYEAENSKVKTGTVASGEYEEEDAWRYCTAIKKKPKTINENSGEENSYGETTSTDTYGKAKKENLISITSTDNALFWKEQNRLFFKDKGNRSGSKFKKDNTSSIFRDLWHTREGNIKDACEKAYKLPSNVGTQSSPKADKDDIFKFCSLKGTAS